MSVIFLALLSLWLALPCCLFWSLIGVVSKSVAVVAAVALWLSLPLLAQAFIAHQVIHPAWHRPGKTPAALAAAAAASSKSGRGRRLAAAAQPPSRRSEAAAGAADVKAQSEEQAFEAVLSSSSNDSDEGQLGAVVGGAVPFYKGKITNPKVDFGLDFQHVSIPCTEGFQWRTDAGTSVYEQRDTRPRSSVSCSTASASVYSLRGWYIPGAHLGDCAPRTLVLLVHGAGRDRRTFMRHSSVFFDAGYSTLLIDCREHGTSDAKGLGTGFCVREACDVIHAARFAKTQLGYSKVVACGTSQGAASCIVASVLSEEIEFDALPENVSGGLLRSPSSLRNNNRAIRRSRSRSRSRSYRASMTRQGDAPSDEELELLHASEDDAAATAAAEDEDARAAAVAAAPLIAGVISENAFCSREACVGDVLHTLLGRPPRVLAPVVMPLQTAFVAGAVLLVRYRLGLFQPTRWNQWAYNWRRALGLHESFLDERAASRFATSPSSTAAATTFAPHASPSSAHLPLPPLRAALPPALLRSGASARMLLDLSPLDLVSRISPRPLLLLHGLLDRIIAPAHSQALYTAARDPRRLMLVAEAHHTALIDADREGWTHTVLQWMAQHGF